ncbi:MAG: hypothetical protein KDJ24_12480 [Gammaproteobacteria bacterium]|nr:hypothetical protein [Gammaproteobacteria bacterium]
MKYECRQTALNLRTNLLIVVSAAAFSYLMHHLGMWAPEQWSAGMLGLLAALAIINVLTHTKTIISIDGDHVTVYAAGMVHGNFSTRSVQQVELQGARGARYLSISTIDGLQYRAPIACFDDNVIDDIVARLRNP